MLEKVVLKRIRWEKSRRDYGEQTLFDLFCSLFVCLLASALLKLALIHPYWYFLSTAVRFSLTMPMLLPKGAAEMSNYAISRDSVLSERSLRIRNTKEKDFARTLREIRLLCRTLVVAATSNVPKLQVSRNIELLCNEAIKLSEDLRDKERKEEITKVIASLASTG